MGEYKTYYKCLIEGECDYAKIDNKLGLVVCGKEDVDCSYCDVKINYTNDDFELKVYECHNKKCGYCFPNPTICPKHDGVITINHKCCPRCKSIDIKEMKKID